MKRIVLGFLARATVPAGVLGILPLLFKLFKIDFSFERSFMSSNSLLDAIKFNLFLQKIKKKFKKNFKKFKKKIKNIF